MLWLADRRRLVYFVFAAYVLDMVPLSQLQYARKYPYTSTAKSVVKQLVPDFSSLSQESFEQALAMVQICAATSPKDRKSFVEDHFSRRELTYPDFLANDVLAFPLAKILLSYARNPMLFERFASIMGDLAFEYLVNEKNKMSTVVEIGSELNLLPEVVSDGNNTQLVAPLSDYLSFPFKDGQLHLVHQSVSKGFVELEMNAACRWVAEGVHSHVLRSLPVEVKGLPLLFWDMSKVALSRLQKVQAAERKIAGDSGVLLQAFPPCMEKLHAEITSGVNLPHMARFDLATFLVNINVPHEEIVNVFSKASNYDEKVTRYHLDNLSGKSNGKKYSAPACAKVREHGLCISRTCNVMHPLQFYARESQNAVKPSEDKSNERENKGE